MKMQRWVRRLLALCALLPLAIAAALAAERGLAVVPIRDAQGHQVGLYEGSYALVVGVSRYTDGWPSLPGVEDDVRAVETGLERAGFDVTVVRDPTHRQLDDAIGRFISRRGLQPDSRLLFYFAGHGYTLKPAYGGEPLGYFVPADAPLPDADKAGFIRTAMSMDDVQVYSKQIQSKHALFLFDSCFSGTIFTSARGIPEAIQQSTAKPVRQFITAGTAGQTVPDQSIFRPQFLAGIAGAADLNRDGYVTGSELGMFLTDTVTNYTHGAETPKYGKLLNPSLDKGDFVFVLPKAAAFTAPAPSLPRAEQLAWNSIQSSTDPQDFADFLKLYPHGTYAGVAKLTEERLRRQQRPAPTQESSQQQAAISTQPSHKTWRDPTTGMEFIYVSGGTYEQGCVVDQSDCKDDEKPTRRVTLSSFWLGKTEVTRGQFAQFIRDAAYTMGENKDDRCLTIPFIVGYTQNRSFRDPGFPQDDTHPVVCVSWKDAQAFAHWLSRKSGQRLRLPTEAEWEYACRAGGRPIKYAWGDEEPGRAVRPQGNIADERSGLKGRVKGFDDGYDRTAPVGSFAPNALGLYDMTGNVWEWVQDAYDGHAYRSGPVTNPVNERAGLFRVLRGGGWNNPPRVVRCSRRWANGQGMHFNLLGFRLARSP